MGVEPTRAAFKHPSDGFEDRGAHQDSTTPTGDGLDFSMGDDQVQTKCFHLLQSIPCNE